MSADDILDVIDVDDNVVGTAPRDVCHRDNLLHRVVHFTLIDRNNQKILLAKQPALKDFDIGMSVFLGGHVASGENYEECLKREIKEELGIDCERYTEMGKHLFEYRGKSELAQFYLVTWNGQKLICDSNEMDGVWWADGYELMTARANIGPITGYWVDSTDWNEVLNAKSLA